jgi:hypothetical protein
MKLVTEGKGTPGRNHGDQQGRGRDRDNVFGGDHRDNRHHGGGGSHHGGGHDQGRMALVPETEHLRPLEKAARATKGERAMALEDGWDPREQGYFTQRADGFEHASGNCFTFDAYGRCPFGDTISGANPKGCKFVHMSKAGKVISAGVQTTVPAGLVCSHCGAVGQHWSFHCERKPKGGARNGGGGDRGGGGRGGENEGRNKDNGGRGKGAGGRDRDSGDDSRDDGRGKGHGGARQRANFCRTDDGSSSNASNSDLAEGAKDVEKQLARFDGLEPAVESAAVGERYMDKVVSEMVPDGGGNHQRAYKAWGRQKLESAKLEEHGHLTGRRDHQRRRRNFADVSDGRLGIFRRLVLAGFILVRTYVDDIAVTMGSSICQMLRDTEEPTHWSKKLKTTKTKAKTKVKTTALPASSAGKSE